MNETLVKLPIALYGLSLLGQQMIMNESINIFQGRIEFPLEIMYKFNLKNRFQSHFVLVDLIPKVVETPKEFRLNKKTRPPIIQWAL